MEISKPIFASVVLLSIMGTALAYPFMMNVYVTNLPLDAQGNVRVSGGVTSTVVTVVKDLKMSWTAEPPANYEYFTVDVDGYNEFVIYASFRNWTAHFFYGIDAKFITDSIGDYPPYSPEYIHGLVSHPYNSPHNRSALYHIRGPTVELSIRLDDYQLPSEGWLLVSISLYLRN